MRKFQEKLRSLENFKAIRDYLSSNHSDTSSIDAYTRDFWGTTQGPSTVLDLGCGEGKSIDFFQRLYPKAVWNGVDIEDSPEVKNRTQTSDSILSFDGVNLPYPDKYFDFIYCNQVLEHVRHPDRLIADSFRTLKPNGVFIGSVSYLEPFHSYSIFNFTPYGIATVLSDAGFDVKEIRPGSDASFLINRQLCNRSRILRSLWNKNYIYVACTAIGKIFRLGHTERNFLKIQFAGQLIFMARRN